MPLIDLTRRVESGMPTYPGDPPVSVSSHATHAADGYRVSAVELGSHAGTHVDAPSHTEPDGDDLGAFPPERFRFDARLVDARDAGPRDAVQPDVLPALDQGGDGEDVPSMYVFQTGWADHWGTARYRDHPYLAPETARACADRGVAVGIDAFSPDPTGTGDESERAEGGDSTADHGVPAHHALLGEGLPIVENLRNLGALPNRFTLHAYPLRLDADGAPVRAVADVDDGNPYG